jgi:myo-inositol catabolism protein IolC
VAGDVSSLGYRGDLYVLAFDHRGSFEKNLFGFTGPPVPDDAARITDAKTVIFEGFVAALDDGAPREAAGLLVDEQYGSDIARRARKEGLTLAMPVEKSGQPEFDFDNGDRFGEHIEEFDPTFAKVLVRYNPEGDREMNARQAARLKTLSDWLHERGRKFLFELLVPAESSQLEAVGGDADRFDQELRPKLMLGTIEELRGHGVEPDVWKIEGLDRSEDCRAVAELVRAGGRDDVMCVVLGRGANAAAVESWLRAGAGVPGYRGFAIGRTIWWDPLKAYLGGSADRTEAARRISGTYRRMIEVYRG